MIATLKAKLVRARAILGPSGDDFLRGARGVIHVGANVGQERRRYRRHGLRALWIEPIPEVFARLQANLATFPRQRAVEALLTDVDGGEYEFHVSNNRGLSSSVFDLKLHKDIWPRVRYDRTITLRSRTLPSLLASEQIDPSDYDVLCMDVQGAELLVLRGAAPLLGNFRYIKTEVADMESYAGGCQLTDLAAFLADHGFVECSRRKFAERVGGGAYYDIVFQRAPR